jgi:hypothetical protein
MATKTPNLGMVLPANNEYFNIWDQPLNGNLLILDTTVGSLQNEVIAARGSAVDLNTRLNAGLNIDGTPIAPAEVVAARSSTVYGLPGLLSDRIEAGDIEIFGARQSLSSLEDALAWDADQNKNNSVLSAATNCLTYTGAVVSLNGSVTPHIANINGYRQATRTIKTTTISGAAGTYYLTLTKTGGGEQVINAVTSTGVLGTYAANSLVAKLTDPSQNFATSGAKPGDVLTLTAPLGNPNLGSYIVLATYNEDPTNLTVNDIAIIGQFVSTGSGFNYTINNPVSPQLGFTGTAHAKSFARVANTIYIGRCVFDGTNVTSLISYANLGVYSGFTSITLSGGLYSVVIPHNLGYFPSKVQIFGSQASDFSQPLDLLSVADLSGGGSLQRSCIAQMSDTQLLVKNPTSGLFYKDFGGTAQTSGFLYVVAER